MAQIIKHRRGSLESVASATKRAGELLVVTGSSGITAANGDSLLFLGIDGSTVTPANKFLQGTSVPDLTGASYDTSIDGIPFYDTSQSKLYILNKAGNVEVKATANTDGTGIVSSSAQIDALGFLQVNGDSVVSASAQITISDTTGFSTFSSSLASTDDGLDSRITLLETFSSSLDAGFVTQDELALATGALEDADSAQQARLTSIEGFTSSIDTTIKTKLNTETVVSGSSQVFSDVSGDITIASDGTAAISSGVIVDADINAAAAIDHTKIDFGGSGITSGSLNLSIAGDSGTDTVTVGSDTFTFAGTSNEIETTVTDNQVQIGLPSDVTIGNNLTVVGNLEVQGTTTTVDSTTIELGDNIIELNGSGAVNGGLLVKDVTAPNTISGSLLWDSTNDYWKAGALGAEERILLANGDGVISGSSQVDLTQTTNYVSGIKSRLNAEGVISGSDQLLAGTGIVSSSEQISNYGVFAELNGDGLHSGSEQVVASLVDQNVNFGTGDISGSNLLLTGNANIDGNIVLGGNITIGDASSDTISFGGEVSSDIIPSGSNTFDLGSATDTFAEIHGNDIYGTIHANNGVISGSSQITDGSGIVSSSQQIVDNLLNQATDFGTGRISGDLIGNLDGTTAFTGSFSGDGSNLTGLATNLVFSGSDGSSDTLDLLNDDLNFEGGTGVTAVVTDNTVTYSVQDASTSVKGIASFGSTNFAVTSGNVAIKAGGVPATALNADVAGTGVSLNGVDNSIEVDYGATAGTAVEGNTSLTVQGTSNEIEVSGGSLTLGNGGTVTIGLPDDVTIATASIDGDLSVGGDVEITGNLSVLGTTTTIDSTTVQIGDNILELNIGGAQSTAGLQVTDSTGGNTVSGSLLWDGTNDYWKAGPLGSEKEIARLNTSPTSNTVLKADANGLLVDSLIADDGTNVTISGTAELRINAATANSFVYFDSNKSLEAVTPSNAGDVIQWNGSSFVASNEIDGGTF